MESLDLTPQEIDAIEAWLAIQDQHAQLIDGRLVIEAMPFIEHGSAQGNVFGQLVRAQRPGPGNPGWWLGSEIDLLLAKVGVRADVAGWRKDLHPRMPQPVVIKKRKVIIVPPNWVCEVLSTSTAHLDLGSKRTAYHKAGVEHYWIIDPFNETVTVLQRAQKDYEFALTAGKDEVIRPPPFDFLDVDTSWFFPEKEPDPG